MLGDFTLFSWKSKETQQREQEQYEKWAFPYGQKQRDNLTALLLAVFPKETIPTTLIPFLTCKELYEGFLKKSESKEAAADTMINVQKKYKNIIKKNTMPTYLALVIADANIDENAEYPSAEDILSSAKELELLRKDG